MLLKDFLPSGNISRNYVTCCDIDGEFDTGRVERKCFVKEGKCGLRLPRLPLYESLLNDDALFLRGKVMGVRGGGTSCIKLAHGTQEGSEENVETGGVGRTFYLDRKSTRLNSSH